MVKTSQGGGSTERGRKVELEPRDVCSENFGLERNLYMIEWSGQRVADRRGEMKTNGLCNTCRTSDISGRE